MTTQQYLLNYIAKEQLAKNPADAFPGVSWRRLWSQFKSSGEEGLRESLRACEPTYLSYSPHPNDSYALTLEGWLTSTASIIASIWLEKILSFLRGRFEANPDFRGYTSEEIRKATDTHPDQALAVHQLILAANLSKGGTSGYGSSGQYHYECNTPDDIIELTQCKDVNALRQLRAQTRSTAATKRMERTPSYILSLSVANLRCFGPRQELDLSDGEGRPKQWTLILGNNGTGKTTLLQAIAAFAALELQDQRLYLPRMMSQLTSFPRSKELSCRVEFVVAFGRALRLEASK
jgi:hypothetical protein